MWWGRQGWKRRWWGRQGGCDEESKGGKGGDEEDKEGMWWGRQGWKRRWWENGWKGNDHEGDGVEEKEMTSGKGFLLQSNDKPV